MSPGFLGEVLKHLPAFPVDGILLCPNDFPEGIIGPQVRSDIRLCC